MIRCKVELSITFDQKELKSLYIDIKGNAKLKSSDNKISEKGYKTIIGILAYSLVKTMADFQDDHGQKIKDSLKDFLDIYDEFSEEYKPVKNG